MPWCSGNAIFIFLSPEKME
uniref:Uncharacterized protein n=1 Tax=Arundo donax TaxID=35708 RepID=A0A0A8YRZ4_ARUDO